jgi:hypothetical protein
MSKLVALGNPMCVTFECRHLVAGVLTLFDPTVVKCSWYTPANVEDAQVYGGTDPRDDDLVKLSTGIFQAVYISTAVGKWSASPYWSHTSGGKTISYRPLTPGIFTVQAQVPAFTFTDSVAP